MSRRTTVRRTQKLLALATLILLAGCANPVSQLPGAPGVQPSPGQTALASGMAGKPLRLLFVGDSLTAGYSASTRDRSYPHLVAHALEHKGRWVRTSIVAQPGATVVDAQQWLVGTSSDIVVVELGTNDHGKSVPLDEFSRLYQNLLRRVRGGSPEAQLVCLGDWAGAGSVNWLGVKTEAYDAVAQRLCTGSGGGFVSIGAAYGDAANHGPANRPTFLGAADWFHPNDRGHQELANVVLDLIEGPAPSASIAIVAGQ